MNFNLPIASGVCLRSLTPADAADLFALIESNRERLDPWLPWIKVARSEADALKYIGLVMAQWDAGTSRASGIEQDGKLIGIAGFTAIDKANRMGEISYWIARAATGQGITTAAVRALLEQGFEELGMLRIQLRIGTENTPSRAVAERTGFSLEGVLRQAEMATGGPIDLAVYSILKSEWSPATSTPTAKKFQCPACSRPIFNRRLPHCEFCNTVVPADLLLSAAEQKAIDDERSQRAAERRERQQAD